MGSMGQTRCNVVVFQLAGMSCAFPLDSIHEIVHMAELMRPPGLPPFLEGFLNLRGTAISVLRLCRLLSLPEQPLERYTPLIILSGQEGPLLAVLVDDVQEVATVSGEERLPVQERRTFNDCVEAELSLAGRTVHLLSVERLLLQEECRRVAELQAVAQRRLGELEAGKA